MLLEDTEASYSYEINNNTTKVRTCEVGATLAPRTPFSGNVFGNINNNLGAVRIFSLFFTFISILWYEDSHKFKYNMPYKVLFLN